MSKQKRLRALWLRARGVLEEDIWDNNWHTDKWPNCVLCRRPWRPDKPEYIAVMGESYPVYMLGHRWCSIPLHIYAVRTGVIGPSMRYICTEHRNRYESVPDCRTGEQVEMVPPPSWTGRAWLDARYWVGSGLRFVGLLTKFCTEWVYEVACLMWKGESVVEALRLLRRLNGR